MEMFNINLDQMTVTSLGNHDNYESANEALAKLPDLFEWIENREALEQLAKSIQAILTD